MKDEKIRFIDLFAGIGGFSLGFERASHEMELRKRGQEKNKLETAITNTISKSDQRQHTYRCVWTNEWDKYASSVYRQHFGVCDTRDITTVDPNSIPDHELLCGGFPCQSFSIAGRRLGFDDTRGTLFFNIAQILKSKHTKYFLLENVKGLLSHDSGNTFKTIISTLAELGYNLQWQVLNSKNFGVPQNRERVFIIGNLRGTRRPQVFPLTRDNGQAFVGTIKSSQGQTRSTSSSYVAEVHLNRSQDGKVSSPDGLAYTLSSGHYNQPKIGTIDHNYFRETKDLGHALDANYYKGNDNHGAHTLIGTYRTHSDGKGFRELKQHISPTIPARSREDGSGQPVLLENYQIRRLTPVECERLQGFPDNWTAMGLNNGQESKISDSQRYKMLGNAVTVNVVEAIARELLPQIV